jgi:hypothetical protein
LIAACKPKEPAYQKYHHQAIERIRFRGYITAETETLNLWTLNPEP